MVSEPTWLAVPERNFFRSHLEVREDLAELRTDFPERKTEKLEKNFKEFSATKLAQTLSTEMLANLTELSESQIKKKTLEHRPAILSVHLAS